MHALATQMSHTSCEEVPGVAIFSVKFVSSVANNVSGVALCNWQGLSYTVLETPRSLPQWLLHKLISRQNNTRVVGLCNITVDSQVIYLCVVDFATQW